MAQLRSAQLKVHLPEHKINTVLKKKKQILDTFHFIFGSHSVKITVVKSQINIILSTYTPSNLWFQG